MNFLSTQDEEDHLNTLEVWNPVKYFGEELYIIKDKAREYEVSLKAKLADMLAGDPTKAATLVSYFRERMPGCENEDRDGALVIPGVSEKEFDLYAQFPSLIEKLRAEGRRSFYPGGGRNKGAALFFGPTDFGGWSYRLTHVRSFVRPVRSFSQ